MGGVYVVTDFDTPVPYVRKNIHNAYIRTFKTDYAGLLKPFGYTLIGKKMYAHGDMGFTKDIQERVSTQIFYKEQIADIYAEESRDPDVQKWNVLTEE